MASYSEFLKLLNEIPRAKATNDQPPTLSPNETYEQLCYDFPLLSVDDLSSFKSEFIKHIDQENYSVFPINNRFIQGIAYGASKYGGNSKEKEKEKEKESTSSSKFYEQYSTINAVALIKFVRNALRTTQIEDLDNMLTEYTLEIDPYDSITEDTDAVIESLIPTKKTETETEHVMAAEMDGDNEVYEPYAASQPDVAFLETPTDTKGDWQHASNKLVQLSSHVSYDKLSHDLTWNTDLELFADLVEIVRSIRAHSYLNLESQVPRYVFLLRDRMLDRPEVLRSYLLSCINVLELDATTVQHSDSQMGVSIFSSIVNQKLPSSACNSLSEIISQNLKFFEQRTASICELSEKELISSDCINELKGILKWYAQNAMKKGTPNVEKELIDNGLVRDLVSLVVKFGMLEEMSDTRHFLSFLSITYNKVAQYIQQVPPLTELITSENFEKSFLEEVATWALAFHIHPLPDSDTPVKWLELAERLTKELIPNTPNGEWLHDSGIVYKIMTFLTLIVHFSDVRNPPASTSSVKVLLSSDSFLGVSLRKFQSEVEQLYKSTVVTSKEDKSSEAKKKRKIVKKQHTILAKLQGLLKSILGDRSKKD